MDPGHFNSALGRARDLGAVPLDAPGPVRNGLVDQTAPACVAEASTQAASESTSARRRPVEPAVDPGRPEPITQMSEPTPTDTRSTASPDGAEPSLPEKYCEIAYALRLELWRFDLNKQHMRVASVILELSYGRGRESVKIDRLRVLCDLTGLDRANVSRALDQLRRMRIVNARKADGLELVEYQIDPTSDQWRCQPLQTSKKLEETLEWVEMLNRPGLTPEPTPAEVELPATWYEQ